MNVAHVVRARCALDSVWSENRYDRQESRSQGFFYIVFLSLHWLQTGEETLLYLSFNKYGWHRQFSQGHTEVIAAQLYDQF